MILGLLQLGCFLGAAWCIGHVVERCFGRADRPGPPPGWEEPNIPLGPPPAPDTQVPVTDQLAVVGASARPVLYVPTVGDHGCPVIRVFRTPLGGSTVVGFTSPAQLWSVLGADHSWVDLAEPALRSLVAPLGVRGIVVDPTLVAPVPVVTSAPVCVATVRSVTTPAVPELVPAAAS